jgi:hypothetical protein
MRTNARWVLVVLAGLGCSGGIDLAGDPTTGDGAASDADADAVPDALDSEVRLDAPEDEGAEEDGTVERYWTLVPVRVVLRPLACSYYEGQTGFLAVMYTPDRECRHLGPVEAEVGGEGRHHRVVVRAWAWEEQGVPCPVVTGRTVERRDVALRYLDAGDWEARGEADGPGVPFHVEGFPSPTSCMDRGPVGATCVANCDCDWDLVCTAAAGDYACWTQCLAPCNEDVDCGTHEDCSPSLGLASKGCEPLAEGDDACDGDEDCAPDMRCRFTEHGNYCDWATSLDPLVVRPCRSTEECPDGLDCVELPDGTRSCGLRCTTQDMRCPNRFECGWPEPAGRRWICTWPPEPDDCPPAGPNPEGTTCTGYSGDHQCADGLYCIYFGDFVPPCTGTCLPPGTECTVDGDCGLWELCEHGYCGPVSG